MHVRHAIAADTTHISIDRDRYPPPRFGDRRRGAVTWHCPRVLTVRHVFTENLQISCVSSYLIASVDRFFGEIYMCFYFFSLVRVYFFLFLSLQISGKASEQVYQLRWSLSPIRSMQLLLFLFSFLIYVVALNKIIIILFKREAHTSRIAVTRDRFASEFRIAVYQLCAIHPTHNYRFFFFLSIVIYCCNDSYIRRISCCQNLKQK